MALAHSDAIRNAVCDLVVDAIDAGSGNPNGQFILQTAGSAEVATLNFANPAFGAAGLSEVGLAIANTITADTTATGGTATKFKITNRSSTTILTGTFGTTGADVTGTAAVIAPGDTVEIEDGGLTYEAMD